MLRSMTLKKNPALNFVDPPRLSEVDAPTQGRHAEYWVLSLF